MLKVEIADDKLVLKLSGNWVTSEASRLEELIGAFSVVEVSKPVEIDLSGVPELDTCGALLMRRLKEKFASSGESVGYNGASEERLGLLQKVEAADIDRIIVREPEKSTVYKLCRHAGRAISDDFTQLKEKLGFLGYFVSFFLHVVFKPSRLRFVSVVNQIERIGFNAVPIVFLISFMIGAVIAYMGASLLSKFGAQVMVVELVSISVMRELGIVLTAIVVAGRSGSSFTAQIGSMKVNQEIDAMRMIGLNPMEVLVLPRIAAIVFSLPILGFIAVIAGLTGGAFVSWLSVEISLSVFLERLADFGHFKNFTVGLVKAPFFATAIGIIGCFNGFRVAGSADSVGEQTTRSVVESIFSVIFLDAVFAILFNALDI